MAWEMRRIRKAEGKQTQQAARHALSELLASSRGLPMKIGQFMAGMDDDSPYTKLTTSIEPWPLSQIKPILEQTWQQPLQFIIQDIEESFAAASIGQVHQAKLSDQQSIAIKVQYPNIAAAIDAEMKLAGLLPAGGPVKTWGFDLDSYKATLKNTLNNELDYLHEMQQQLKFSSTIHVEGLHIPHVFPVLCRKNILVQEWAEGVRLSDTTSWPLHARQYIARTLMQTMFQSLFEFGLVHGDPHPGNLLIQYHDSRPQTTLLDFGCMVSIEKTRRIALLKLILSSRGECETPFLDTFVALGFDAEKLKNIEDKLPQLAQLLFLPFKESSNFDLTTWQLSDKVASLLGEQRWWFRSASPADLFLLIRIFQGLVTQLETLYVQLPWWPLLQQAVKTEIIEEAMCWQPGNAPTKKPPVYKGSAKQLHIDINRQGKEPMHLKLSPENALQLEILMPEHVHKQLHEAHVDLAKLREKLLREGLEPQSLINIKTATHHYHIYLT